MHVACMTHMHLTPPGAGAVPSSDTVLQHSAGGHGSVYIMGVHINVSIASRSRPQAQVRAPELNPPEPVEQTRLTLVHCATPHRVDLCAVY